MPRSTVNKPSPTFLAVGPWDHGEFATVRHELDPTHRWPTASSLDEALNRTAHLQAPPELILLAQPRPGCDDQTDVERCRTAWPLTRIVVVAGAWCEGELRTGRPLTGVIRLYWHELPPWWRQSLALFASGKAPPWSAPLTETSSTAGSSKVVHVIHAPLPDHPVLAIDALDIAAFESLESALKPFGWRCVWQPRHRSELWSNSDDPAAGLWDGAQLGAEECRELHQFCTRLASAPVIALVDFPRPEHIETAQSAGAAAIIGKPYSVAALLIRFLRLHPLGGEGWEGGAEGQSMILDSTTVSRDAEVRRSGALRCGGPPRRR